MSISPLQPGESAPDFALPDDRGQVRTLGEFKGQWLSLWWQPVALTKGCRSCGERISGMVEPLLAVGVNLVGVTLNSVAENAEKSAFVFEQSFPILSADWETANAYRAARPADSPWAAAAHPIAYLMNPAGLIERSWLVTHQTGRDHIDGVINHIESMGVLL